MFGMSMMSMKPLFPAKGRGRGYRVARRWAEQQTTGWHFFTGEGNSATKKGTDRKHAGTRLITQNLDAEKSLPPSRLAGQDRFQLTPC